MQKLQKDYELATKTQQIYSIFNQGRVLYIKQPSFVEAVNLFAGIKENMQIINNIFNNNLL